MNGQAFLRSAIALSTVCAGVFGTAQEPASERKVRIEVIRNENGSKTHVTREFDLNDEQQLADALRELGVMDELNVIGNNENLVIDLKRMRNGGALNDMCVALSLADAPSAQPNAYLGVYYGDWNEGCDKDAKKSPVKEGACVTGVEDDAPAAKAGLQAGDVIVALGGHKVGGGGDLVDAINDHKAGDKVDITYYRGRDKKTVAVVLAAKKPDPDWNWNWNWDAEAAEEAADEAREQAMEEWARAMEAANEGAFLGVEGDDLDNGKGVRLTSITDSSAAERMGLHEGDILRSINGEPIKDFEGLADMMSGMEPGADVRVAVTRDDKEITFSGELGSKPRIVWNWNDAGLAPIPPMPPMAPMAPMPPMVYRYNAEQDRSRAELRREMDQLRSEMDRLRHDLRSDVVNEMRVTVDAVELSSEEAAALKNKGVANLGNALELPGLQIYPNPTDDSFRISFDVPERGDLSVDMHDAHGDRVYHESISGFKGNYQRVLDWSDHSDGTYFVVIAQNGKALARKLVKQ